MFHFYGKKGGSNIMVHLIPETEFLFRIFGLRHHSQTCLPPSVVVLHLSYSSQLAAPAAAGSVANDLDAPGLLQTDRLRLFFWLGGLEIHRIVFGFVLCHSPHLQTGFSV